MAFAFTPVTAVDLPLLEAWISQPHWQRWWGEPETEIAHIRDMIEGRDTTRPFLFSTGGRKVGYVQYWFIADQIAEGWSKEEPWLELVPEDAVGVDISIGPESLLGRGYGSAALRQFCRGLAREGFKTILIDPDEDNLRAVRSYEKAGFRAVDGLKGKAGGCIIMQHAGANEESDA